MFEGTSQVWERLPKWPVGLWLEHLEDSGVICWKRIFCPDLWTPPLCTAEPQAPSGWNGARTGTADGLSRVPLALSGLFKQGLFFVSLGDLQIIHDLQQKSACARTQQ